jgi:hypothetical protein
MLSSLHMQTGESFGSKVDAFANYSHGACSQDSLSSGNQVYLKSCDICLNMFSTKSNKEDHMEVENSCKNVILV